MCLGVPDDVRERHRLEANRRKRQARDVKRSNSPSGGVAVGVLGQELLKGSLGVEVRWRGAQVNGGLQERAGGGLLRRRRSTGKTLGNVGVAAVEGIERVGRLLGHRLDMVAPGDPPSSGVSQAVVARQRVIQEKAARKRQEIPNSGFARKR